MDKSKLIISKPALEGQVGESHVWDGPLDVNSFPKGKGSSSGKDGMDILKDIPEYKAGPITQKVKRG